MRHIRIALAVVLVAVGGAALGAAGGDEGSVVRGESMLLLSDPQAQLKLHRVTDAVQDWAEAGPAASLGYAGTVIDAPNRRADIYWAGELPAVVRELIGANSSPGLTVTVRPGAYSRVEMQAAVDRFVAAAGPGVWTSVGPKEDGSGIAVTYDPAAAGPLAGARVSDERYAERAGALAGMAVTARPGGVTVPLSGGRRVDTAPYYAGAQVRTSTADFCSAAFTGWKGAARVQLTAGHCGAGRYYSGADRYIGDRIAVDAGLDVGLIGINGDGGVRFYDGRWSDTGGSSRRVYGSGRNNVGDLVCLSGAQSGWVCDVKVTSVDVRTKDAAGAVTTPVDVAESRGGDHRPIVAKGDSGGPVLADPSGPGEDMAARGVVIAGGSSTEVGCPANSTATPTRCYWQVIYVPMTPIVSRLGFSLS
ncbi:hypothetical protein ACIRPK_17125 [Kitasatospora sp. NPDC101801]|uniref:hypothetical protein n=1 Tax=Kitasatospora sp. NPDC101801 TaxID=3364103 RepID=UPI0038248E91